MTYTNVRFKLYFSRQICIQIEQIFILIFLNYSYYIGHRIVELDQKMKAIKLPKLIRRNFRPLSEREYFKAHEWKFILLFVAYPLLKDILPERYEICKFRKFILINIKELNSFIRMLMIIMC